MYSVSQLSSSEFNEVVLADFCSLQIAVLTRTTLVHQRIFSAYVPVPQRRYQSQGWLIFNGQITSTLENLVIEPIGAKDSPFDIVQRIGPAIPLSFEVKSALPLPALLSAQAAFAFELPNADFSFHSIFRQMRPRFVRIYPFREIATLSMQAKQLLSEEALFVTNHCHRLRQVPFYRDCFGL